MQKQKQPLPKDNLSKPNKKQAGTVCGLLKTKQKVKQQSPDSKSKNVIKATNSPVREIRKLLSLSFREIQEYDFVGVNVRNNGGLLTQGLITHLANQQPTGQQNPMKSPTAKIKSNIDKYFNNTSNTKKQSISKPTQVGQGKKTYYQCYNQIQNIIQGIDRNIRNSNNSRNDNQKQSQRLKKKEDIVSKGEDPLQRKQNNISSPSNYKLNIQKITHPNTTIPPAQPVLPISHPQDRWKQQNKQKQDQKQQIKRLHQQIQNYKRNQVGYINRIKQLEEQLAKYKLYVKEYEQLGAKNKYLEEQMAIILNQLENRYQAQSVVNDSHICIEEYQQQEQQEYHQGYWHRKNIAQTPTNSLTNNSWLQSPKTRHQYPTLENSLEQNQPKYFRHQYDNNSIDLNNDQYYRHQEHDYDGVTKQAGKQGNGTHKKTRSDYSNHLGGINRGTGELEVYQYDTTTLKTKQKPKILIETTQDSPKSVPIPHQHSQYSQVQSQIKQIEQKVSRICEQNKQIGERLRKDIKKDIDELEHKLMGYIFQLEERASGIWPVREPMDGRNGYNNDGNLGAGLAGRQIYKSLKQKHRLNLQIQQIVKKQPSKSENIATQTNNPKVNTNMRQQDKNQNIFKISDQSNKDSIISLINLQVTSSLNQYEYSHKNSESNRFANTNSNKADDSQSNFASKKESTVRKQGDSQERTVKKQKTPLQSRRQNYSQQEISMQISNVTNNRCQKCQQYINKLNQLNNLNERLQQQISSLNQKKNANLNTNTNMRKSSKLRNTQEIGGTKIPTNYIQLIPINEIGRQADNQRENSRQSNVNIMVDSSEDESFKCDPNDAPHFRKNSNSIKSEERKTNKQGKSLKLVKYPTFSEQQANKPHMQSLPLFPLQQNQQHPVKSSLKIQKLKQQLINITQDLQQLIHQCQSQQTNYLLKQLYSKIKQQSEYIEELEFQIRRLRVQIEDAAKEKIRLEKFIKIKVKEEDQQLFSPTNSPQGRFMQLNLQPINQVQQPKNKQVQKIASQSSSKKQRDSKSEKQSQSQLNSPYFRPIVQPISCIDHQATKSKLDHIIKSIKNFQNELNIKDRKKQKEDGKLKQVRDEKMMNSCRDRQSNRNSESSSIIHEQIYSHTNSSPY